MGLIADSAGEMRVGGGKIRPAPRVDVAGQRMAAQRNKQLGSGMSEAARRAMAAADAPAPKQRFVHETDIGNAESIRKGGINPSRGGGAMGHEGVYAYEGEARGRRVPEGRALIEFEADPRRISGRGTTPGSRSVALSGGRIDPGDITGGYSSTGRMFNLLGGSPYSGLYGLVAGLVGLPQIRTPADMLMASVLENQKRPEGWTINNYGVPTPGAVLG